MICLYIALQSLVSLVSVKPLYIHRCVDMNIWWALWIFISTYEPDYICEPIRYSYLHMNRITYASTLDIHIYIWTGFVYTLRCSVLQCAAVCCSVLQCAAVCCSVLQCVAVCCSVLQCVAVYCSVLQCIAVCCSVLQCVAVCCSEMSTFKELFTYSYLLMNRVREWICRQLFECKFLNVLNYTFKGLSTYSYHLWTGFVNGMFTYSYLLMNRVREWICRQLFECIFLNVLN